MSASWYNQVVGSFKEVRSLPWSSLQDPHYGSLEKGEQPGVNNVTMDFSDKNLATIASLHLHNMTAKQLVEADSRVESHFHLSKGVWWREVKPFFYHPALPMARIVPHQATPKPWLALGGYYHLVPEGALANGSVVVNEITDLASYDLEKTPRSDKRRQIRRGLALFRIARITNLDEILDDGYRIYLDWETRTSGVRVKRSDPTVFRLWISRTLSHPHKLIVGAYLENRLVAYLVAHAVDGVAEVTKPFSDSSVNHLSPMSTLVYAYIRICGQNPQIRKAFHGLRGLRDSLERFKAHLGFRHVSYPAFICLRFGVRQLVRWRLPNEYRRLTGQYPGEPAVELEKP